MALPAGVTSISTPGSNSSSVSAASSPPSTGRGPSGCTSRRRPRPPRTRGAAGSSHVPRRPQPRAAAPAREQVRDRLLEVPRRRLVGLLERLPDPLVGVADQALELGERGLEVLALRLQVPHVGTGVLALLLRERVHRPELLAAARQAFHPRRQLLPLLRLEW